MKRHLRLKTDFPLFRFLPERWTACLFLIGYLCCTACGDDEEDGYVYPSLLTEFVEVYTDAKGNGTQFVTDNGKIYAINSPIQGLQPDAAYRLVCGYEVTADYQEGHPVAKIYTVETVNLLKQKEEPSDTDDPLAVPVSGMAEFTSTFTSCPRHKAVRRNGDTARIPPALPIPELFTTCHFITGSPATRIHIPPRYMPASPFFLSAYKKVTASHSRF